MTQEPADLHLSHSKEVLVDFQCKSGFNLSNEFLLRVAAMAWSSIPLGDYFIVRSNEAIFVGSVTYEVLSNSPFPLRATRSRWLLNVPERLTNIKRPEEFAVFSPVHPDISVSPPSESGCSHWHHLHSQSLWFIFSQGLLSLTSSSWTIKLSLTPSLITVADRPTWR